VTTVPTIGNNIEIINFEGMKMELWDLGGLCNVKQFWHNYYEDADAVVFFADLSNNEASYLQKSRDLLSKIAANKKISQVPILILANKKDRAVMSLLDLNR
jgi:GTPase SAR1 family protein